MVVWGGLQEIYGSSFTSAYGSQPSAVWTHAIAELTDEEVAEAIRKLAAGTKPGAYPCNLTEFMEVCRPKPAGVRYAGGPSTMERPALEEPRASYETAQRHIRAMRERLGMKVTPEREPGCDDDLGETDG